MPNWTLTFLFVQSSHFEFCCFLHESLTKETMRVVDSECPTPHIFLIEGIHTFSSKTWCLIWIAAWGKMQKKITNGYKLFTLIKFLFLLKFHVWFTLELGENDNLLPLVNLIRIISSKILCLILCEARLKLRELIFNGIKLFPLVNLPINVSFLETR